MLAIVCRSCEGAKALELYEKEGYISKSSGLHGLGASMGRTLNGRFLVICLENLRHGSCRLLLRMKSSLVLYTNKLVLAICTSISCLYK